MRLTCFLSLVFVFSIGAIVTVCSCIRIKYMSKFGASENLTWYVQTPLQADLTLH